MPNLNEIRDAAGILPAYAWPGGYPLAYVCDDGESLCPTCANLPEAHEGGEADGWRIEGYDINYEDADLYCAHCNERIQSAYADDDEPDEDAITTTDHERFYQYGGLILHVYQEPWQTAVKRFMDAAQMWPDIWFVSDHGNPHRLTLDS